jgi:hypothetical protein
LCSSMLSNKAPKWSAELFSDGRENKIIFISQEFVIPLHRKST